MIFFHFPLTKLRVQKAAGYRRLLKSLFPPMKRLVLHLIFGSFILPQAPAALVRCSRGWWMGARALGSPKIQKPWVRLCCCHDLCHPNTMWVCAMGMCPVRSPWMAPASPFQSAPPVVAKFCPNITAGMSHELSRPCGSLSSAKISLQAAPSKGRGIL